MRSWATYTYSDFPMITAKKTVLHVPVMSSGEADLHFGKHTTGMNVY